MYGRFRLPEHENQCEKLISALIQLQMSWKAKNLMLNCTQKQATAPDCNTPKEAMAPNCCTPKKAMAPDCGTSKQVTAPNQIR
jgi:hypothetical protein